MDDLAAWAESPLFDDEPSKNWYQKPLRIASWRAWMYGRHLARGIPKDQVYRHGHFWCAKSPESHRGPFRHAVDFLVPDGSVIRAAAEGKVVELVERHERYGDGAQYRDTLNFITLAHENGEYTQYCHVLKDSAWKANVWLGSHVSRGQPLARVGKTGWTDRDHLHFIVFRDAQNESPFPFKSLVPRFRIERRAPV